MSTYPCYKFTEGALYNFQLLKNLDEDWRVQGADKKSPMTVYFNICHYADTSSCSSPMDDGFAYRSDDNGNCQMLTSESPQAEVTAEITRSSPSDPDSEQRGIRILRAGGDICPADDTRLLSFTLDVFCDQDSPRNPTNIKSNSAPFDDEEDPCNIYVQLEHSAGCPEIDYGPALNVLGACMIFAGVMLQYFGPVVQRSFMRFLVSIAAFVIIMAVCFKLNWLALFDPTEPDKNKSVFLAFLAILLAGIGTIVVNWAFNKAIRFAPTFVGVAAGFWFSIYLIAAINGVGGIFVPNLPNSGGASKDIIGPVWGAVIEMMGSIVGAVIGY